MGEGVAEGLIGDNRFSVDGTLMSSLAGHMSVKRIHGEDDDLNGWSSFKGRKHSNAAHCSVMDPEARLVTRGGESHLSHSRYVMT